MPNNLAATLGEQTESKTQTRAERRQQFYDAGRCVTCPRKRESEARQCKRCTARAVERNWRRRQTSEPKRMGKKPTRGTVIGWNFDTDDLIIDSVGLAKKLAYRASYRVPSSSTVDMDDLVGDAMLGLVVAARTYDTTYQVPFGAWATKQIVGAIYDGMKRWTHSGMKQPPVFVELAADDE